MAPAVPYPSNSRSSSPSRKPATIAALAERALEDIWDERKELKHFLRIAERSRKEGKEYTKRGDLENAFISFARAATLVLEKMPTHRDYKKLLSEPQRQNLTLNGQDILDNLGALKPALLHNYEQWEKEHPEQLNNDQAPDTNQGHIHDEDHYEHGYSPRRPDRRYDDNRVRGRERERDREKEKSARGYEREMQEELQRWKEQREDINRQREEEQYATSYAPSRRGDAAVTAARHAAARPHGIGSEHTFSHAPPQGMYTQDPLPASEPQRAQDEHSRHQQQQAEFRRREEEIVKKREEKRREEKHGIAQRQQEADQEARAVRQTIAANNPGVTVAAMPSSLASAPAMTYTTSTSTSSSRIVEPSTSFYQATTPTQAQYPDLRAPRAVKSRPPSFLGPDDIPVPPITPLPLESPTRYEGDSTDSESLNRHANESRRKQKHVDYNKALTRGPAQNPYPPPVTTTSPPPVEGNRILYPQLMSQHQKTQGYFPSLNSMFGPVQDNNRPNIPSSLLFVPDPSGRNLYPHNMLPQPSMPPPPPPPAPHPQLQYPYGHQPSPSPQPHLSHPDPNSHPQSQAYPSYPGPARPAPPVPVPPPPERITRVSSTGTRKDGPVLRTVVLPRDCLRRFLTIARANTERNMETCGLLLGRDKGNKYVVSTLLIPKQHSTSDTCTMDEEELVLRFTEERNLITLGWIHTHPSQSCFMSSVDLHTHSGFQRMLPESFAVVCAPKSTPNFGIFRLTDPPGLKTILDCNVKDAFHPHPDIPIYTDADKGHVQMKDISLEIVDLR